MGLKTPVVAAAGICCMDYIIVAPQVQWGDNALVSEYVVQGGGLIGTATVACARLGAECDLLSLLGDDSVGDEIVAELAQDGIPSDGIQRIKDGKSPFCFVHVDDSSGDRTIFYRSGTGLTFGPDRLRLDAVRWNALLVDDIYLDLSMAAAKAARERGVPVVADLIPDDRNAGLLKMVDVLIAPRHYAKRIGCEDDLDSALDAIHELGPTTAMVTLGADGWVSSDPRGRDKGEAFKVDVVDTTGAGDAFHGAFCYGLASGWETARCGEISSAVAAIKCTKIGGRTGLPSLEQVTRFLAERS